MRPFLLTLLICVGCNNSTNVQRLPIGSPCMTSDQCGSGVYFCAVDHPNGYCKADCHSDGDCPTGSVCAGAGMVSPGECHKKCSAPADCRTAEGYICKMMPSDASSAYCDVPEGPGDGGA
jgi:hypothetical protein